VPRSDKVNNLIFCLHNQARLLHLIAHIFKTAPICMVFSTLQCHVVLNMTIEFTFINCLTQSSATWWKKTTHFPLFTTKCSSLKSSCFLASVQMLRKIDCTCKDVWCVRQSSCCYALMPHMAVRYFTMPHCTTKSPSSTKFQQTTDSLYLHVFQYTAVVSSIQQSVQTGSARCLMLKFPQQSLKVKSELLT